MINCLATAQRHYPFGRKKVARNYDGMFRLGRIPLQVMVDRGNHGVIREAASLGSDEREK